MEIRRLPDHNSVQLNDLGDLITSGFESSHASTVNTFVNMWNASFGAETQLEYPERVARALRRYADAADLELPTFPDKQQGEVRLHFYTL